MKCLILSNIFLITPIILTIIKTVHYLWHAIIKSIFEDRTKKGVFAKHLVFLFYMKLFFFHILLLFVKIRQVALPECRWLKVHNLRFKCNDKIFSESLSIDTYENHRQR